MGELQYADLHKDDCKWEPKYMPFMEPSGNSTTNSQIAVSENAATCSLNALARSPVGQLRFNEDRLNRMFEMFPGLPHFYMNTTSVGKFIPLFKEKLGRNKPLQLFLDFKNIDVKFGEYDTDVILSYTACVSFRLDKPKAKTLFYDELKIVTTGQVRQEDNVLYVKILSHKLDNQNKYA